MTPAAQREAARSRAVRTGAEQQIIIIFWFGFNVLETIVVVSK